MTNCTVPHQKRGSFSLVRIQLRRGAGVVDVTRKYMTSEPDLNFDNTRWSAAVRCEPDFKAEWMKM